MEVYRGTRRYLLYYTSYLYLTAKSERKKEETKNKKQRHSVKVGGALRYIPYLLPTSSIR